MKVIVTTGKKPFSRGFINYGPFKIHAQAKGKGLMDMDNSVVTAEGRGVHGAKW